MNKEKKINYRKRVTHELHKLKHRKKYIYKQLHPQNPTGKIYPEDYEWINNLCKEYEMIEEKIDLLEKILKFENYGNY